MTSNSKNLAFRWVVLISVFLNVIFHLTYSFFTDFPEAHQVSASYFAFFHPAEYSRFIWAIIFTAFILYAIIQIAPSQRTFTIYDRLSVPVILINFLSVAWIIFYTQNHIGASLFVIILSLFVSYYAFRTAYLAVQYANYNLWLQFPFSLLSGWLMIVMSCNFFVFLHYLGWTVNLSEGFLTALVIVVNTVAGFLISKKTFSLVYPAAIAWGLIAIGLQIRNEIAELAAVAMGCGILLVVACVIASVFRKVQLHPEQVKHTVDF